MKYSWLGLFAAILCLISGGNLGAAEIDSAELDQWASDFFNERLKQTHVPGAVLVIVKDGEPVVMRGFGVTTPQDGGPIDPQETLFRVGSITKVMTAIATLQLIEEGVIDPDEDVNVYLDGVEVPSTYNTPITVSDLLVHEGGLGSELRGAETPEDADSILNDKDVQRLLVPRVRAPGLYPAYDNNGWGLLGMTAADAAGATYRELIRERVFAPLEMDHAVIGLPAERRDETSLPHNISTSGDAWPIDYSVLTTFEEGAGNASATGADMARFMAALLQGGELDGERVLTPDAFAKMTEFEPRRIQPGMPGYGRPLYEFFPAGRYAIRHDGGISGFVSSMVLYPEENAGVFWSINAQPENPFNGDNLSNMISGISTYLSKGKEIEPQVAEFMKFYEFHEQFADKYISDNGAVSGLPGGKRRSDAELKRFEGAYRPTREEYGVFIGNFRARLLGGLQVRLLGDGVMQIGPDKYVQNEKGLFEKEDGPEIYAFMENDRGVFMGPSSLFINKKVGGLETPLLTILPLLGLPLLLLTAAFHLGSRESAVRTASKIGAASVVVFIMCLLLEGEYANSFLVDGKTLFILLWRLVMTLSVAGLAGASVLFASGIFQRATSGPHGVLPHLKTFHLLLLAASAAGLVALAVYWRLVAAWL